MTQIRAYNGTQDVPLIADPQSNVLVVTDHDHYELHEGDSYVINGTNTLGNGGSADVLLITPDTTKTIHLLITVRGTAEASYTFYEGVTVSANGSAATAYNRNRQSANTATAAIYTGPTVTDTGTMLNVAHFGSGNQEGGHARSEDEWMLARNTIYLVRMTSEAADNEVSYHLSWYEHTSLEA